MTRFSKLPHQSPSKWVVDCQFVGKGAPALQYLSRYLYRGVYPTAVFVVMSIIR
ncbi:transposase [Shewanella xiamenensis]|uniref:transposase n=1 Tax=Shewanella xiamenensis TaxID=332186 RepID=UPI003D154449